MPKFVQQLYGEYVSLKRKEREMDRFERNQKLSMRCVHDLKGKLARAEKELRHIELREKKLKTQVTFKNFAAFSAAEPVASAAVNLYFRGSTPVELGEINVLDAEPVVLISGSNCIWLAPAFPSLTFETPAWITDLTKVSVASFTSSPES